MTVSEMSVQSSRPKESSRLPVDFRMADFDEYQPAPVRVLADLHARILPTSPLVRLGRRFMERFYYQVLPKDGLIFGAIAYVNETPAAFIVATHDSSGFIRSAVRSYWPRMTYECGMSLLTNPGVLRAVPEALSLMKARFAEWRHRTKHAVPKFRTPIPFGGEILSIGTLPEYQTSKFLRETRLNLANELLDFAVTRLRDSGTEVIRCVVDADNKPAQFFYHCRGWRREPAPDSGWKVPVVEFVLGPEGR
jgi:ribosomal protein S18 acetylase RimI-like enzyme